MSKSDSTFFLAAFASFLLGVFGIIFLSIKRTIYYSLGGLDINFLVPAVLGTLMGIFVGIIFARTMRRR